MARILLVEDEINVLKMTQMMLTRAGHEVTGISTGKDAIAKVESEGGALHQLPYDVVLTDYRLGDVTGLEVLKAVKRIDQSTQVLLVTAYATTHAAVEAMREGAFDYIEKPFKRDEILALVQNASIRRSKIHEESRTALPAPVKKVPDEMDFIGKSPAMMEVLEMVRRVAPTKANILITGESGTGKEVIARLIHQLSEASGAFVPVNCGAIPETLVESEFFGYMKGAFTGATRDKPGFFKTASGGSIFLDEIGELPMSMQVKLLRAIQEKKIQPVGSTTEIPVNVRVIAATNRDLRTEVQEHRFREDLFFRLNVIQLSLPPLRERKSDLPLLIDHFLKKYGAELGKTFEGVEPDVMDLLLAYDYRGNVRELENIMEHSATLELGRWITMDALPAYLRNGYRDGMISGETSQPQVSPTVQSPDAIKESPEDLSLNTPLVNVEDLAGLKIGDGIELEHIVEDLERSLIEQSLAKTNGNKTEAAKLLGISFRSMRYRLKKYNME